MGRGLFPEPREDSGWAWVVCFASFMLQFLTYGLSNAYATMFVAFLHEFKQGEAKTAWIGSTVIGLNFLLGPFSTALCDRWGCRSVALMSSFFLFSALVTTSFVTQFTLLYVTYGLCLGVASSLGYATSVIVLTKYFKRHLSLATGIGMAGAGLGTMTITSGASIAIAKYGWRFTLRCMSASSVVVFVCGLSFVPFEKCPKKLEVKKKFLQAPAPRKLLRGTMKLFYDPRVWKNKAFAVWSLAIALIFFANFAPFIFLTRMATDIGVPLSEAALLPGYLTVAQSFGKLLFGKLADLHHVNRISLYQAVLFTQGIATTLCPLATKYWALVMYAVIFGLTDGCFGLMLGLGTYDVAGPEMMTRAFGCMSAVVALPLMTGPVVTGLIYDVSGTYSSGFFVGGGVTIAGVFLLFLIPILMSENDMEIREEIEMNDKKTKGSMSSDPTQKQPLITDDENRLVGTVSAKSELQVYSSRSRPSSLIFLSAFPSLALSSNFLQEASLEESERELREDLYISALLKRIDLEIDRHEEVHLFRNRSEDLADKIGADSTEEDTSGIGLGSSSSSKSLSNLSSDRLSKQSTDQYQCTCSAGSEEGVVLSEDEISLSWDCFSELVEEKPEQNGDIKPHFPLPQNGYDCFSQLMEEQLSNACSCSCSLVSLDSTSCQADKELANGRTVGCLELSGCDQGLAFAPETKL